MTLDQLEELARKATPGPWCTDTMHNDGEYGNGPDARSGFNSYVVIDGGGRALFDTLNSDVAEVHEDWDEDGGSAWDEVGERNADFIAACSPDRILKLVAAVRAAETLQTALPTSERALEDYYAETELAALRSALKELE